MRRLFAVLILLTCSAFGATHYIWVSAIGTGTGADFTNAFTNLQASPVCGDTYVIAGDAAKYAAGVTITTDCSSNPVTYRKAQTSDSGVAGYQAAFVSTTVTWQDTTTPDPSTVGSPIFTICGGGHEFDGITGNPDPITGPSGFGFTVSSANPIKSPNPSLIALGCVTSPSTVSHLWFKHMHIGGVGNMPFFGFPDANKGETMTCGYSGTTLTLTRGAGNWPFITGDKIDGGGPVSQILFSSLTTSNVTGGVLTATTATNWCTNAIALYQVALSGFPFNGIQAHQGNPDGSNNPVNFIDIQVVDDWFENVTEHVRLDNCFSCLVDHNYMENNRTTPQQHGSPVQIGETANAIVSGPVTVSNNFILNGTGSGVITHLGQSVSTSCPGRINCGTISGLNVIGNIVTCNTTTLNRCPGDYTSNDNAANTCVINSFFINNVMANIAGFDGLGTVAGKAGTAFIAACSTGNLAENNIIYGVNYNGAYLGAGTAHHFNVILNSATRSFTPNSDELVTHSGTANPFVNDAIFNFALTTDVGSIPIPCSLVAGNCFQSGTSTHATLPANDVDYYGTSRNSGNGWDIGALQFVPAASSYTITAICAGGANGTIIGSAGSVMNAVCTAGVCSGTCSESITAGNSGTYTGTATTGSMTSFSIGACVTNPCTVIVNGPLTVSATFQATVSCTLTFSSSSVNVPNPITATITTGGLTGNNWFWTIIDPFNVNLGLCNTVGCQAGLSGNFLYTGSGKYTCIACSNGSCTGPTQPLNVNNIGIGGFGH